MGKLFLLPFEIKILSRWKAICWGVVSIGAQSMGQSQDKLGLAVSKITPHYKKLELNITPKLAKIEKIDKQEERKRQIEKNTTRLERIKFLSPTITNSWNPCQHSATLQQLCGSFAARTLQLF